MGTTNPQRGTPSYRWMDPKPPAAAAASARRLAREAEQLEREWIAETGGRDLSWGRRRRGARIGWGLRLPLPGQPVVPEAAGDAERFGALQLAGAAFSRSIRSASCSITR